MCVCVFFFLFGRGACSFFCCLGGGRVFLFLLFGRGACSMFFFCLGGGRVFFFAVWAGGGFFCCLGGGREFTHLPVCLARL